FHSTNAVVDGRCRCPLRAASKDRPGAIRDSRSRLDVFAFSFRSKELQWQFQSSPGYQCQTWIAAGGLWECGSDEHLRLRGEYRIYRGGRGEIIAVLEHRKR